MTPNKKTRELSILVAEDNHANQMVIRKILSHAGHQPVIAGDGEQALEALSKQDFDVILLDLNMPRMNGFETLKFMHFALHDEDIPIIALTADASIDTNNKCLNAGFDACITKPYNPNTLLQTIQNLTDSVPKTFPRPMHNPGTDKKIPTNTSDECMSKLPLQTSPPTASSKTTAYDAPQPIDPARVATLADLGDTKFFNNLINEFDSEALEILSQLRMATDARNVEKIRLLAHALKSSAVNFGATQVVQKCERLEYGDRQDVLNAAAHAVADLRSDYEDVRSALVALAISRHGCEDATRTQTHH